MAFPFTRLVSPDPQTNRIANDIYDKLQQNQAMLDNVSIVANAAQTAAQVQALIAASSSGGSTSGPTTIPQRSLEPGTNPSSEPLDIDGSVIIFSPAATTPGTLYRLQHD